MTEILSELRNLDVLDNQIIEGIVGRIGNTPLIQINRNLFEDLNPNVRIYGKAEWFNPGGSVKDRPAWNMIRQALIDGELTRNRAILDASSGNTGIALAMIGSALGYDVTICIPSNATKERIQLLRAYGATLELTDPLEGTDGAIERARELVEQDPDQYCYVDQYNNENNWKAHYDHTGPEIIRQTNGKITHFVTGLGTSGTFSGITKRLREEINDITCISMQPDTPFHGLEGLKHMETALAPGIYNRDLADSNITVSTKEAQEMTKRLAKEEGILVGISSGANLVAAAKVASTLDEGCVVTILCDRGERYLSDQFWENEDDN